MPQYNAFSSSFDGDKNSVLNQNPTLSQLKKSSRTNNTSSFEALMSLDFASMQSMEELSRGGGAQTTQDKPQVNWNGKAKAGR